MDVIKQTSLLKTLIVILLSFSSFGQKDSLEFIEPVEIIEMCDTYIEPNFIGGTPAMLSYIMNRISFPDCPNVDLNSTIYVMFIVEKDGDLSDVEVFRSPCPEMDEIIIKLFEDMPLWSPGSDAPHGAVRSRMKMPINICFQ